MAHNWHSIVRLFSDLARPLAWFGTQGLLVLHPTMDLLGAGALNDRLTAWLTALEQTPPDPHPEDL